MLDFELWSGRRGSGKILHARRNSSLFSTDSLVVEVELLGKTSCLLWPTEQNRSNSSSSSGSRREARRHLWHSPAFYCSLNCCLLIWLHQLCDLSTSGSTLAFYFFSSQRPSSSIHRVLSSSTNSFIFHLSDPFHLDDDERRFSLLFSLFFFSIFILLAHYSCRCPSLIRRVKSLYTKKKEIKDRNGRTSLDDRGGRGAGGEQSLFKE